MSVRDPEFDEPVQVPGQCPRGRCDGSGWILVSAAYVDKHAPWPDIPEDDPSYDTIMGQAAAQRAAVANSLYPCPACLPGPFMRWREGHWTAEHDRARCPTCNPRARKEPTADASPDLPHRADLA